jgi:endonuclease G
MSGVTAWFSIPGLTGPERKQLRIAILEGASRESLRMALSDAEESRDYDALVRPADFATEVDELVRKAAREGWLEDLITAFVSQTDRQDLIDRVQAIATAAQARKAETASPIAAVGWGWKAAAAALVLAVGLAVFYLLSDRDPNFVVRLVEKAEPVGERSVFVARVAANASQAKRSTKTTNGQGEAYFHLELGSGQLYRFGVKMEASGECSFPAFTANDARQVVYELNEKNCRPDASGLLVRTEAPRQPDNVAAARVNLPIDLTARSRRAPLGLPGAPLVLDRRIYSLGFDPSIRSPRWVSFIVDTRNTLRVPRRVDAFLLDPVIPRAWQTDEGAYRQNNYDRGHLVRRSDALVGPTEADARAGEAEIYLYSVTVPQADATNRVTWLGVEEYTTQLSARVGQLYAIAGPIYPDLSKENGAYLTLGQSRTVVPLSLYRVLLRRASDGRWRAIAFLVPNDGSIGRDPEAYVTSVAAVEKATGLSFFPNLPAEEAGVLKANISLTDFES